MMMAQGQWKQFVRREMENSRIFCAMRLVLFNTILFFFLFFSLHCTDFGNWPAKASGWCGGAGENGSAQDGPWLMSDLENGLVRPPPCEAQLRFPSQHTKSS